MKYRVTHFGDDGGWAACVLSDTDMVFWARVDNRTTTHAETRLVAVVRAQGIRATHLSRLLYGVREYV